MNVSSERNRAVAYVPFTTFLDAIKTLEHGIPNQIDTSMWPSYSTAIKAQLLGAFRFLGLVDASGKPTKTLRALVHEKSNRKDVLKEILRTSYAGIVGMDLTKTSPRQFDSYMRQYGMKGETHKKVISFFLRAASYAELPMSPLLGRKTRAVGIRRTSRVQPQTRPNAALPEGTQLTSKQVVLRSGGRITLNFEGSLLNLDTSDRNFFFELFDKLRAYEK